MDLRAFAERVKDVEEKCHLRNPWNLKRVNEEGHLDYSIAENFYEFMRRPCLEAIRDFNSEVDSNPKIRQLLTSESREKNEFSRKIWHSIVSLELNESQ